MYIYSYSVEKVHKHALDRYVAAKVLKYNNNGLFL